MKMPYKGMRDRGIQAWHRWAAVFEQDGSRESLFKFAEWTGDAASPARDIIINVNNPEVMKKIDIILGPNGYTMLKMWKAQQDG